MRIIKTYEQFVNKKPLNEAFTITLEQLPKIGDIVDKIEWRDGDKTAFIDFKGIKNIPVLISDMEKSVSNNIEQDLEQEVQY